MESYGLEQYNNTYRSFRILSPMCSSIDILAITSVRLKTEQTQSVSVEGRFLSPLGF